MKTKDQILKIKATVLYLLGRMPEGMDYIHLAKMMYFAQREHLVLYGLPLMDDTFYARKHGPVPRITYKVLKHAENDVHFEDTDMEDFRKGIVVDLLDGHQIVRSVQACDEDELSRSDIIVLDRCFERFKDIDSYELGRMAHDKAWQKAKKIADRTGEDVKMPLYDIAEAGGASREMLSVIKERQWIETSLRQ